jgi:outer membrane protein assembly factor BamA
VFKVEETTRYLVQPLVGYGSYEQIRAGLEFEMLSVFGSGFDFDAKGVVSAKGYRLSATLSDNQFLPSVFGYDTSFGISADSFRREEPSYTDGAFGITPSLGHNFSRNLSGRVAYIFREHNETDSDVIDPSVLIGTYTEGSVALELTYDSRLNPLRPTSGTRVALQIKRFDEGLGGDITLERAVLGLSSILPITDSTRFVIRGEAGWLIPEQGSAAIPIQEKFFNGGEDSVRSFREDKLAPANLLDINGAVIGGEYRNILNAELRWAPPWQPMRAIELEFALFGDAGNIGRSVEDYGFDDMRYALGGGLRFLLPIGPVRFDLAKNPERGIGERNWTLHFSIGYPF